MTLCYADGRRLHDIRAMMFFRAVIFAMLRHVLMLLRYAAADMPMPRCYYFFDDC